ncbi:MAG: ATP-binding protein, partial [Acetobacteraceae bacterium]|nr:ATP-binding protein [Acetobacteraceae bacterium]
MSRRTLQSKLDQRAGALIGRERERAALLDLVERDTPLVAVVHGIAGVGKSTLLHAAAVDARVRGALVVALDGRAFEPTERGFVTSLGTALGTHVTTIAEATDALASDARVLLAIDTYEQLRLLDAWLRQTFVPALPHNVRLVLAGRDTPSAWQRELGDLLRAIRLDNLSDKAAQTLLRRAGVEDAGRRACRARRAWAPALPPAGRRCVSRAARAAGRGCCPRHDRGGAGALVHRWARPDDPPRARGRRGHPPDHAQPARSDAARGRPLRAVCGAARARVRRAWCGWSRGSRHRARGR